MEKKNMVLLTVIAVATLLVAVVGATFAYFTATITDNRGSGGNNGQAAITATQTPGNLTIEQTTNGFSSFNDTDVYPGHKDLIQLKITASSNTADTYFNIVYNGTNTFPNNTIKFTLYESKEDLGSVQPGNAFTCSKKTEDAGSGNYKLFEKCDLNTALTATTTYKLGEVTPSSSGKTTLNGQHPFVITGNSGTKTLFYYVVVEYVNQTSNQTEADKGKALNGKITIEIAAKDDAAIKDDDQHLSKKNV